MDEYRTHKNPMDFAFVARSDWHVYESYDGVVPVDKIIV